MKRYLSLFNCTEITAVLDSFPKKMRRDIWMNNFAQEVPSFGYFYRIF
jgi:hypothetical protein